MQNIAEQCFKAASAEAALFELRMRLRAGAISTTCDLEIETKLAAICNYILNYYKAALHDTDEKVLQRACNLRNKLLHCEFSVARQRLSEINPKARRGGVTMLDVDSLDGAAILNKLHQVKLGRDVGQKAVAHTKTKKLKDVFGWLLETQGAGEFDEAAHVFRDAISVLERLGDTKEQDT